MTQDDEFARARERMVEEQLSARDIVDPHVLQAMRDVPRHRFVPEDVRHLAYADCPLPIGHRQTISQPYIVALMIQLLQLKGDEHVLEVGTGSGYQAAVLARLARQVYTIERIAELAEGAQAMMCELGISNVTVVTGDGTQGLPEHAPFEAVIVAAAAPRVPEPLQQQLSEGGRLVVPVGSREGQVLERWIRRGDDFHIERVAPVAFVPLVGDHGWDSDEGPRSWFG
jgi:protein-L-isoaspartate(D-aspartate) O-methyltransferase